MVLQTLWNRAALLVSILIHQYVLIVSILWEFIAEPLDCPVEDVVILELTLVAKL